MDFNLLKVFFPFQIEKMRRFWRVFSSRRRLQLLVICFTLLAINTILVYRPHDVTNKNRKFTSKNTLDNSAAAILNLKLQPDNLAEPKTVSYNEIIPPELKEEFNEIIISQEVEFSDSENDLTTSQSTMGKFVKILFQNTGSSI